mgnify:CR=1 FL=1
MIENHHRVTMVSLFHPCHSGSQPFDDPPLENVGLRRMEFICHIGQPKTASTTIQMHLARNRQLLKAQGILYPASLGTPKSSVIPMFCDNGPVAFGTSLDGALRSNFESELFDGLNSVLLSEERLFDVPNASAIKERFSVYASSWRILCYIRRPEEHIVSRYSENIRAGYVYTLNQYFEERLTSHHYRVADRLEQWTDVFGDGVEVRVFDHAARKNGVLGDFLGWIGADSEAHSLDSAQWANRSLDRTNTEIMRFLNRCLLDRPDVLQKHHDLIGEGTRYRLEAVRKKLLALDGGERLRLDPDRANLLLAHLRISNEILAKRYLSAEHGAALLSAPAETSSPAALNTGTVFQRMMAVFDDEELAEIGTDFLVFNRL